MEGFLKKRRETDRWLKRWCVLTQHKLAGDEEEGPALYYFHKQTDKTPAKVILLHHCLLKKSFLDFERRENLVRMRDKAGRTPLHLATEKLPALDEGESENESEIKKFNEEGETVGGSNAERKAAKKELEMKTYRVASWLVEHGADQDALDVVGNAPKPVPISSGGILKGLKALRASESAPRREVVPSSSERKLRHMVREDSGISGRIEMDHAPLLPPPRKLFGFTYASFFVERLNVETTVGMIKPTLRVSVYNAKGKLTEEQQDVTYPVVERDHVWWAQRWHMQTPLETLGTRSLVIFELNNRVERGKAETLAWGCLSLDKDELNTRTEVVVMYLPPTDPLVLCRRTDPNPPSRGNMSPKGLSQGNAHPQEQPADMILQGEVALTRMVS
ncbi:unnamed protein product [Discosporangium mesarthrocarpum]